MLLYRDDYGSSLIERDLPLCRRLKDSLTLRTSPSVETVPSYQRTFLRNYSCLRVRVDIDIHLLPLAGRDLALEHDVDLAVGAILHFRQEEVGRDQADESRGAPNVAALAPNYIELASAQPIAGAKDETTYGFHLEGSTCMKQLSEVSFFPKADSTAQDLRKMQGNSTM